MLENMHMEKPVIFHMHTRFPSLFQHNIYLYKKSAVYDKMNVAPVFYGAGAAVLDSHQLDV